MASINDLTPGTWTIDASHTTVGFTARHLMITKVRGRFGAVDGTVTVAEDRLHRRARVAIDLAPSTPATAAATSTSAAPTSSTWPTTPP